jgi:UDP-N-acetylmuramate: L-alanyl-gamma-D-glutamyl-meso-diaminopimelate ligase
MGALASMLQDLGFRVTGSDGPLYPPMSVFIDSKKIPRVETYGPENLRGSKWGFKDEHPSLIVIGNAISRTNAEAQHAEELVAAGKSRKISFAAALAEFCIRDRESFVVAGTHGKTSTTTQLAWALESLGLSPGFFIGGIPANFAQGCRMGEGDCFASEGDEYDTAYWDKESKFLHYRPSWVLCTGIEFDHADIYANVEAIESSFHKLITKTAKGWIHVDVESAPRADVIRRLEAALEKSGLRHVAYGRSPTSVYRLVNLSEENTDDAFGIRMSVVEIQTPRMGRFKVSSPLSGEHNALNLLGIVATLEEAGKISKPAEIQKYLSSFKSVKRRQEELYRAADLVVIDDFAHHPTAIRETIRAIRKKYPRYDVAAFFEPRSATSARNVFQKEFTDCFDDAAKVYLTPPTKTNVPQDQKLDVYKIQADLNARGVSTFVTPEIPEMAARFKSDFASRQDKSRGMVALVMSNGAFGGLHQKLFEGRG